MKNRRNYYRVLHIQPDAPLDIIKASYRTQMQKLKMHPDLGGDEWDASVLNEAYRILSNPKKRAAYDAAFIGNRNGLKTAAQTCSNNTYARRPTDNTAAAGEPFDKSACAFCQTPRPGDASFLDHPFCSGCGGPLQVAATLRLADPAKRAFERMPHHAPLTVHLDTNGQRQRGKLRDLSPVGLQMQSPAPLKAGQVVRISGEVVAAIGRVVFCNRNPDSRYFTAGVEFLTVCFHSRAGTFIKGNA